MFSWPEGGKLIFARLCAQRDLSAWGLDKEHGAEGRCRCVRHRRKTKVPGGTLREDAHGCSAEDFALMGSPSPAQDLRASLEVTKVVLHRKGMLTGKGKQCPEQRESL